MTRLAEVAITGVAFWSPRLPGWDLARDVALGRASAPDTPLPRPAPALLAPTERRRAPDTVALALEVASRACQMAGVEPRDVPSVFASTYGDLPINDYMCSTLATTPTLCSPTKFHNSVHNAAAGYWGIATGAMAPSQVLCAYDAGFAAGLLEAMAQALTAATPILLVSYDAEYPEPIFATRPVPDAGGVALLLAPVRSERSVAALKVSLGDTPSTPMVLPALEQLRTAIPAMRSLPMLELLARLQAGTVSLDYLVPLQMQVEVAPC